MPESLFLKKSCKPQTYNFIKRQTLAQMFSCKFFEISKNTFSYKAPPVNASVNSFLSTDLTSLESTCSNFFVLVLDRNICESILFLEESTFSKKAPTFITSCCMWFNKSLQSFLLFTF